MLTFIINKNSEILNNKVKEILKEENISVERQTTFSPIKTRGLFNEKKVIWLSLENKDDLKTFVEYIKNKKNRETVLDNDLLISTVTLQGISKIEKFVEENDGTVIKEKENNPNELLKEFPLKAGVMKEIVYFVGDSPELLIPLINSLKNTSNEKIKTMGEEDVLLLLPTRPGDVPPFKFLDPMIKGDVENACRDFYRSVENTHPLVSLVMLKNKLTVLNRANALYMTGIRNNNEMGKILGSHPYPIKLMWHLFGKDKEIQKIMELYTELEEKMKGGYPIDSKHLFARYLTEITIITKELYAKNRVY